MSADSWAGSSAVAHACAPIPMASRKGHRVAPHMARTRPSPSDGRPAGSLPPPPPSACSILVQGRAAQPRALGRLAALGGCRLGSPGLRS